MVIPRLDCFKHLRFGFLYALTQHSQYVKQYVIVVTCQRYQQLFATLVITLFRVVLKIQRIVIVMYQDRNQSG